MFSARRCLALLALVLLTTSQAPALELLHVFDRNHVGRVNQKLAGQVVDYTFNHGSDRRVFSNALGTKRDMYVYLPPGYDGTTRFPALVWLHGLGQSERMFLNIVDAFDDGIRNGTIPPLVIVAPDGTVSGKTAVFNTGSFYLNSKAGNFEDYIVQDVWGFLKGNYAVRPEREAHLIAGASMGGFGAFNLGFKYKSEFGLIGGIMPPLNLRYSDAQGNYFGDYFPGRAMLRNELPRTAIIGRFYHVIVIRSHRLLDPLLGRTHPDPIGFVSRENPIEMLTAYNVQPNDYEMFIGYGTRDEFNIDAQVQHFLEVAHARGIRPCVVVTPGGRHSVAAGMAYVPAMSQWASKHLNKFVPPGYNPACPACGGRPLCAVRQPMHFPVESGVLGLVSK